MVDETCLFQTARLDDLVKSRPMTKILFFASQAFAALLAALLALAPLRAFGADSSRFADPLNRPALHGPRSPRAVMLGVASAGTRIVAAGERGIVIYSDDDGLHWQQANVPVSTTLTGLEFPTPSIGFAIGHAGVVLRSDDAGQTWARVLDGRAAAQLEQATAVASGDEKRKQHADQLVQDGADKPFLALHFDDALHGFVVGAYGLAFGTTDGGRTWSSWMGRLVNPRGLHLNAIAADRGRVLLAGEQGLLLRSSDGGQHFECLASPYKGSWFGVARSGQDIVIAGLKGHAWWSSDDGVTWNESVVPVPASFSAVVRGDGEKFWFSNQAGGLLVSEDGGHTLRPLPTMPGPPITALAVDSRGDLLLASFAGASKLVTHARRDNVTASSETNASSR